jgi:hypothetical protein
MDPPANETAARTRHHTLVARPRSASSSITITGISGPTVQLGDELDRIGVHALDQDHVPGGRPEPP